MSATRRALVATLCLVAVCASAPAAARKSRPVATLDPVGTWNCVVYGHPAFGDERVLLNLVRDRATRVARLLDGEITAWVPLTHWDVEDATLTFTDSRSGRDYKADLTRTTLGGTWRTATLLGGWWCSPADFVAAPTIEQAKPETLMPPLLPSRTATPVYPIKAIRDAKQGRAVSCFFVDAEGYIVQPEIVELSDEIFRAPILNALARSRYEEWPDKRLLRPGCRSFIFRLDPLTGDASTSE
ncbi:MAG TPA: hypothetical protein VL131_15755 [Gammaproteobacteria bacterium]|nr:hypothetical protein [Gammaproteobacteria bacterium]